MPLFFFQDKEVADMEGGAVHLSPHLQPAQDSLPYLLGVAWGSQYRWEGLRLAAPHSIN